MKRIILIFLTIALTGGMQCIHAQGTFKSAEAAVEEVESIMESFSECRDAEVVSLGSMLINLAKPFVRDPEAKAAMKMAKGLVVADLEDCSADVRKRFDSQVRKFVDSLGEFKLMEVRDGDDNVIIIGDEDKIAGMLVCGSDSETVLIKLSAKPDEFEQLMKVAQ